MTFRVYLILLLLPVWLICTPSEAVAATDVNRLVVTHSQNYPPFSYLDTDGRPQGYLIDLWKAFGRANRISVEFKLGVWQQTLDWVKDGTAQVHAGMFYSRERDRYFDYGTDIMEMSTALYLKKGVALDQLSRLAVGVVRGGNAFAFMHNERSDQRLVQYEQIKDLVQAAADGEIVAFVADQPTGSHYLRVAGLQDVFISRETLYTMPLRAAVREGDHEVLETLLYGWPNIDQQTRDRIYSRWFIEERLFPGWLIPAVAALILLGAAFPFIRRMLHHVYAIKS